MSAARAQDFVLAAKNAARDILNDEARSEARRIAHDLVIPFDEGEPIYRLCKSIKETLLALPYLPIGTRPPAAVALQHLARTVDLILRIAAAKAGAPFESFETRPSDAPQDAVEARPAAALQEEERHIPYRPGVDD